MCGNAGRRQLRRAPLKFHKGTVSVSVQVFGPIVDLTAGVLPRDARRRSCRSREGIHVATTGYRDVLALVAIEEIADDRVRFIGIGSWSDPPEGA